MALRKQTVVNEFIGELSTLSGTDWVVTFPTKHHFVSATSFTPAVLVQAEPDRVRATPRCCDTWDREETPVAPGGPDFSPSPTPSGFRAVLGSEHPPFKSTLGSGIVNVLGSGNSTTVATGFTNGWARLT